MKKHQLFLLTTICLSIFFMQCTAYRQQKMENKNAETIRLWFEEGWNKHQNEALIERVFAPDWEDGNPIRGNQTAGLEGMRQTVQFYEKAFADTHFTITHLFATKNQVALRYTVVATHMGDAFGIPKTGKKFISTGIVLYEMEHGKIKRSWQELDLLGIINQLKEE